LAALTAQGCPAQDVDAWLRHAGRLDDRLFRPYVTLFLLDLMSELGQAFNGNESPSSPHQCAMQHAFDDSVALTRSSTRRQR
ncbi:hypothetical protein, partial [Rhodoblastus sp.]|uniref:hypothetical protein n=1 Tax=Rhodoblastus sp. TaxID=1962975 RepID=UPI003F9B6D1A